MTINPKLTAEVCSALNNSESEAVKSFLISQAKNYITFYEEQLQYWKSNLQELEKFGTANLKPTAKLASMVIPEDPKDESTASATINESQSLELAQPNSSTDVKSRPEDGSVSHYSRPAVKGRGNKFVRKVNFDNVEASTPLSSSSISFDRSTAFATPSVGSPENSTDFKTRMAAVSFSYAPKTPVSNNNYSTLTKPSSSPSSKDNDESGKDNGDENEKDEEKKILPRKSVELQKETESLDQKSESEKKVDDEPQSTRNKFAMFENASRNSSNSIATKPLFPSGSNSKFNSFEKKQNPILTETKSDGDSSTSTSSASASNGFGNKLKMFAAVENKSDTSPTWVKSDKNTDNKSEVPSSSIVDEPSTRTSFGSASSSSSSSQAEAVTEESTSVKNRFAMFNDSSVPLGGFRPSSQSVSIPSSSAPSYTRPTSQSIAIPTSHHNIAPMDMEEPVKPTTGPPKIGISGHVVPPPVIGASGHVIPPPVMGTSGHIVPPPVIGASGHAIPAIPPPVMGVSGHVIPPPVGGPPTSPPPLVNPASPPPLTSSGPPSLVIPTPGPPQIRPPPITSSGSPSGPPVIPSIPPIPSSRPQVPAIQPPPLTGPPPMQPPGIAGRPSFAPPPMPRSGPPPMAGAPTYITQSISEDEYTHASRASIMTRQPIMPPNMDTNELAAALNRRKQFE